MLKSLLLVCIFLFQLNSSQTIEKIEFAHSNPIYIGSSVNISIEPVKNNKKGKAKINVKKKEEEYNTRISREKFMMIFNAIQKINPSDLYTINGKDTIAVLDRYLDPSSSSITIYYDKQNNKSYYADNLTEKSQHNEKQKGFWHATKLIIDAAKLRMEDLIDYK